MKLPRHDPEVSALVEVLDARLAEAAFEVEKAWTLVTDEELLYIDREIERCIKDRRYYLENYHVIKDEQGQLKTLYKFWDHQEIIFEHLEREWKEKGCFRGIILKPRQCGGTVWSAGVAFHATIFTPHTFTLLMAHDAEASAEIDRRVRVSFDNLPWWLKPEILSRQQERQWVFERPQAARRGVNPGLGSTILISDSQRKAGVAVGRTVKVAHFSEVSRWEDASTYTADIKPSMNARDTLAIMESTAYGRNGLFFNQWRAAEAGKSAWTPIFIPVYRVRKYFIPLSKGEKFELTDEETKLRKAVKEKENFTIPLGFFKWKRNDIQETINSTGDPDANDHFEAYPVTPGEAFVASGFGAFPKTRLNEQEKLHCRPPLWIGDIEYNGPDNEPILRLHKPEPEELLEKSSRLSCLWLWEKPDDNDAITYEIGADVSAGQGPDFSDAQVYRLGYGPEPHVQVAEWHGLCNPSHFARILAALGYWYHTAEIAVEYKVAGVTTGDELLHHLDYPNLYRWKRSDRIGTTLTMTVHWMTTQRTREDAINRMNEALIDRTIIIRNRHVIEEMRDFGRLEGEGKAAGLDNEDDMVMASIICICAAHETAIKFDETFASSSVSHLMPRTPEVLGLYDHFMRQIGQFEGLDQARKFMEGEAKKYKGSLEWVKTKAEGGPGGALRATLKVGAQTCFTLREIQVMKANTPWSVFEDSRGAEHELHYKHGVPERGVTPELVQLYREMLTRRHYEGGDD
jgi:hypothetical protein